MCLYGGINLADNGEAPQQGRADGRFVSICLGVCIHIHTLHEYMYTGTWRKKSRRARKAAQMGASSSTVLSMIACINSSGRASRTRDDDMNICVCVCWGGVR